MINCHRGTAKRILDDAYRRIGVEPAHGISGESVQEECEALDRADFVFCPNPMVEQSLLEFGLDRAKFIESSYGWDPSRFAGQSKMIKPLERGVTVLFVGSVSVRKGAHLILDYWSKSGVEGRLVLAGKIEPVIKERFADLLCREDVVTLDYVRHVGPLYRSADFFVFPTLEEGGPQVTYEACGCGLPVITTPMGAGRIVRDGVEGIVLDPYDAEGWISSLQKLAQDVEVRSSMARAARASAENFHWRKVAQRRRDQVVERMAPQRKSARSVTEWAD
jgi:glycosyltransferase involved in cell wall biosynthesis